MHDVQPQQFQDSNINGQMNIQVMSWLAKNVAEEAMQSPTVIYLPKSALLK